MTDPKSSALETARELSTVCSPECGRDVCAFGCYSEIDRIARALLMANAEGMREAIRYGNSINVELRAKAIEKLAKEIAP